MSGFKIRRGESEGDEIRRIVHDQTQHATALLRDPDADPVSAVHTARKDMKKVRATLKLVRPALGKKAYKRENARYADAGRMLSAVRDAQVRQETVDGLAKRFAGDPPPGGWEALGAVAAGEGALSEAKLAALRVRTAHEIEAGDAEFDGLRLDEDGFDLLRPGLKRSYARGRAALDDARDEPSDERLHAFRKRSKDLWYHLRLLRPAWPEPIKALADEAHELSDRLGDDHDLAVLSDFFSRDEAKLTSEQLEHIRPMIEEVRGELQRDAFAYGDRFYAEKPKAFVTRLDAYWRTDLP